MSLCKTVFLVFSGILSILLYSCQADETMDINQEKIFTDFESYYIQNEDKTYAIARFKYKDNFGRSLKLSEPSEVFFNGDKLDYNESFQYYQKVFQGFIKEGVFNWKTVDGISYSNKVIIKEVHLPDIDTISKQSSFLLKWEGAPLENEELMTLIFSEYNGAATQIVKETTSGATSISLSQLELSHVSPGTVTLILERSSFQSLNEKTEAGGLLLGKYRPLSKNSYLK